MVDTINGVVRGARWNIPFKDKKRINIALSRPVIVGEVE